MSCTGGSLGQPVQGTIQIALSVPIGNRVEGGLLPEVKLALESGGNWIPVAGSKTKLLESSLIAVEGVNGFFGPSGTIGFRISGLRGVARGVVQAFVSPSTQIVLPVPNPLVTIGFATAQSIATNGTTTYARPNAQVPPDVDFNGMLAAGVPFLSTRITERDADALKPRSGLADTGTRVLIEFTGVNPGGVLVVPDAITGSTANEPTSGGDMGLAASAGSYVSGLAHALLLSRVAGARPDGAGGTLAFTPSPGLNQLSGVAAAELSEGVHYAVYEVLDSNAGVAETMQFPAWIVMPPNFFGPSELIRQRVTLAPLSGVEGPSSDAPIPRFTRVEIGSDCEQIMDCQAPWFPSLEAFLYSPSELTLPSGGRFVSGHIGVRNGGGGILEWRASVRYTNGSNWISLTPQHAINNVTLMFNVIPTDLDPGFYQAEIVVTGAGSAGQRVFPIKLTVTEAEVPPPPPPQINDIVNAANRLGGPVAPGSLVVVLGGPFDDTSAVTVAGRPARVEQRRTTELVVEIPTELPDAPRVLAYVQNNQQKSNPWGIEILPVAPAVLFAFNEADKSENGESKPATAGEIMQLFVTGTRFAEQPAFVRLHDREITELLPVEAGGIPSGVEVYRFRVPGDLPTMRTAVQVCGQPQGQPDQRRCAHPFDVFLKARQTN